MDGISSGKMRSTFMSISRYNNEEGGEWYGGGGSETHIERMGKELGKYFPEGSPEYQTVMDEWERWVSWKPAERRPKKDENGNLVEQEQPEYRNWFRISMNHDVGDIYFGKAVVFAGEEKKRWHERVHGIITNSVGTYQLTV